MALPAFQWDRTSTQCCRALTLALARLSCEKSHELCSGLSNFDEIWDGDASWLSIPLSWWSLRISEIRLAATVILKSDNLWYLKNLYTNLDKIRHSDASWLRTTSADLKIQDGSCRHFEKLKNCSNSAVYWPVFLKFGMVCVSALCTTSANKICITSEIQDCGCRHLEN